MIGFFPDPYPDELLYSICARFHERVQYRSSRATIQELFGATKFIVAVGLPNSLEKLTSFLPSGHQYTVERLIDEHSLLPFCSPFLELEYVTRLRKYMLEDTRGNLRQLSLFAARGLHLPEWFQYCSLCVDEDKKLFGECYWHRLHQIPGVKVCPVHKVFLEKSKVRTRSQRLDYELISAEEVVEVKSPHLLDSSNPSHEALLKIAYDATWLLHQPNFVVGFESIRNRYLYLLENRYLSSYAGKVHVSELSEAFINYYPPGFLTLIHCEFDDNKQHNWLFRLLRLSTRQAHYPLHHLLLIHFLGFTVEEFFKLPERISSFGDGPWPCLNQATKHFRQPRIEECQITRNVERDKPVGKFSCTCGFVYSRTGLDKSPEDRFRYSRVISYGAVWESILRELWSDSNLALDAIGNRLGVTHQTVKRQAIKLGLSFPRPGPTLRVTQLNKALLPPPEDNQTIESDKLETYRSEWLCARNRYPNLGRTFLQNTFRRIHSWLYINDREWLIEHLPPRQQKEAASSFVNWENRDAQLAEAVKASAQRLRNIAGYPTRITKTAIANELEQPNLAKGTLDKLPLTAMVLAEEVETLEEFAIRRIWWARDYYRQENVHPTLWQLKKLAGLSSETAALPQVDAAIDAAVQSLEHYVSPSTISSAKVALSNEA